MRKKYLVHILGMIAIMALAGCKDGVTEGQGITQDMVVGEKPVTPAPPGTPGSGSGSGGAGPGGPDHSVPRV
ncbi:MAG: hypothetical protein AABY86_09140, partial [Bdellovibrionota bacterium]